MTKLMSFGEALIDLLPADSGPGYLPIAGGAPANVAVAFAKLGGRAVFCGGQGDDPLGRMLARELQYYGVDTRPFYRLEGRQTALVLVSLNEAGERSFGFYRQNTADLALTQHHVDSTSLADTDIFHFCSNSLTESGIAAVTHALLEKAAAKGALVSFDVNLRLSLWSAPQDLPKRVTQCFSRTDLLKLSADELEYLARAEGKSCHDYVQDCLKAGVTLVLVTDGPNPVKAYAPGFQQSIQAPAVPVIDTTAAGDSFIAGFLWALSSQSLSARSALQNPDIVRHALSIAVCCGALVCQAKGAFPSLPTKSQLQDLYTQLHIVQVQDHQCVFMQELNTLQDSEEKTKKSSLKQRMKRFR